MNLGEHLKKKPIFWVDWEGAPAIRLWKSGEAKGIPVTFGSAKHAVTERMGSKYRGPWIPKGVSKLRIRDVVEQEKTRTSSEETWALLQGFEPKKRKPPVRRRDGRFYRRRFASAGAKGPDWRFSYRKKAVND